MVLQLMMMVVMLVRMLLHSVTFHEEGRTLQRNASAGRWRLVADADANANAAAAGRVHPRRVDGFAGPAAAGRRCDCLPAFRRNVRCGGR